MNLKNGLENIFSSIIFITCMVCCFYLGYIVSDHPKYDEAMYCFVLICFLGLGACVLLIKLLKKYLFWIIDGFTSEKTSS